MSNNAIGAVGGLVALLVFTIGDWRGWPVIVSVIVGTLVALAVTTYLMKGRPERPERPL